MINIQIILIEIALGFILLIFSYCLYKIKYKIKNNVQIPTNAILPITIYPEINNVTEIDNVTETNLSIDNTVPQASVVSDIIPANVIPLAKSVNIVRSLFLGYL